MSICPDSIPIFPTLAEMVSDLTVKGLSELSVFTFSFSVSSKARFGLPSTIFGF